MSNERRHSALITAWFCFITEINVEKGHLNQWTGMIEIDNTDFLSTKVILSRLFEHLYCLLSFQQILYKNKFMLQYNKNIIFYLYFKVICDLNCDIL